jgi:hypothetical protein
LDFWDIRDGLEFCLKLPFSNWRKPDPKIGKLANWQIGKLASWQVGKLVSWYPVIASQCGMVNWQVGKLVNWYPVIASQCGMVNW